MTDFTRETSRVSDVLRASSYIFIFAVQALTIWHSQSRGPWLGIVAAGFFFPYLAFVVLQRQVPARRGASRRVAYAAYQGFGFRLGTVALAGVVAGISLWVLPGRLA